MRTPESAVRRFYVEGAILSGAKVMTSSTTHSLIMAKRDCKGASSMEAHTLVANRTEPASVLRHDAQQLRGNPQRSKHVVAGDALDTGKLVLGSHIADWNQLQATFPPVGTVHE